jgi:amino-acid N-acetyltransferase
LDGLKLGLNFKRFIFALFAAISIFICCKELMQPQKVNMKLDQILKITFSGFRSGEENDIRKLITECGLYTEDLSEEKLKHFVIARKGDQIVGAVGVEIGGSDALLRSLVVSEPFRNQGVASQLTTAIERYALSQGVKALYLLTLTAEGFFAKQGYKKADRHSAPAGMQATYEFQSLCPDSAVCMWKRIKK